MSIRALLLIPLALVLALTVLVATGEPPERAPTRVSGVVLQCGACTGTPPWIWIPWLPVPVPVQLPMQWPVG